MEAVIEVGSKNIRRSYIEHPIVNANSPSIRRTNKGRIYSSLPTTDGGPRPKRMARKHLCPKYYTPIYIRMAYLVSTPHTTIL